MTDPFDTNPEEIDSAAQVESKFKDAVEVVTTRDSIYQPAPTERDIEQALADIGPITTESPD